MLRDEITKYVYSVFSDDLLAKAAKVDTVPNSVQIKGKTEVKKIALGVSASPAFINQAITQQADYLIVHHGLPTTLLLNGRFDVYENRLRAIFNHNLTLAGFHYALDTHPEIGNNAQIIKLLGAKNTGETYFSGWGYVAEFNPSISRQTLTDSLEKLFHHPALLLPFGPDPIKRLGVCSGGAVPRHEWFEVIDKQIDAHLTGEIKESVPYLAEECGINYFACGHYATEVFGIKALAAKLQTQFGNQVAIDIIDLPTDL